MPKPYDTPKKLGIKWQLDVKQVPKACYVGRMPDKFYLYTVIDEASNDALYLNRTVPIQTLGWLTPLEKQTPLLFLFHIIYKCTLGIHYCFIIK